MIKALFHITTLIGTMVFHNIPQWLLIKENNPKSEGNEYRNWLNRKKIETAGIETER